MWDLLAQSNSASNDAAASALGGLFVGTMLFVMIGALLVGYVVFAVSLMTIAKKTGTPNEIWAWIPILNFFLAVQIAQLPQNILIAMIVCFVASFLPLIGILGSLGFAILSIYTWMKIAERRGKPNWIALLMLIPCVGFFVPPYIAFSDN